MSELDLVARLELELGHDTRLTTWRTEEMGVADGLRRGNPPAAMVATE
jgi:hypothetical protein